MLSLLLLSLVSLAGCSNSPANSPTPSATPTAPPTETNGTPAPTDTPLNFTPFPNLDLTKVALAIATENAIGATPPEIRQQTAAANMVATQNAINYPITPLPTPFPTVLPTPQPIHPLPTLPTLAASGNLTLTATLLGQLNLSNLSTSSNSTTAKVIEPVMSLALSPNGKLLAIGGKHAIWLWNAQSGQIVQTVYADASGSDERGAASLSWSPDGKQLAAGGLHGVVMIWQLDSLHNLLRNGPLRLEPETGSAEFGGSIQTSFSPDNNYLGVIDSAGIITIWDSQSLLPKGAFTTSYAGQISWSPDSHAVADEFLDVGYLTNAAMVSPTYDASINSAAPYNVAWSPDGKSIAVSAADYSVLIAQAPAAATKNGVTKLQGNVPAPVIAVPVNGSGQPPRPLGWSANSQYIAVGNIARAGQVTIWQANSLKTALILNAGSANLNALQWGNQSLLLTGDATGMVSFWQIKS